MTKIMRYAKILFVFFLYMHADVFAGMQFQTYEIKDEVSPLKNEYVFEFKFTNTGQGNVEISSINTSCFCIKTDTLKKRIYKEGETGIIRGVVDIAGKSGVERQKIMLETLNNNETTNISLYVQLKIQKNIGDFSDSPLMES